MNSRRKPRRRTADAARITPRERLAEYRRKRDFAATPEPATAAALETAPAHALRYVVQLHHARRRHFDFRLELEGSLRSWAVPKGPSLDPAARRLAVQVEDHPLDYAGFEGRIPDGHYGAGEVRIWDEGLWRADGDAHAALVKGHLKFELLGTRLRGHWSLVRTQGDARQPQWLLIKSPDAEARKGDIADDTPLRDWRAERGIDKAGAITLPQDVGLQLATLSAHAPRGDGWLHEEKFDGYRLLMWREDDIVRIRSRGDQDWTMRLPALGAALRALPCRSVLLDAELVALDAHGRSRFGLLQQAFSSAQPRGLVAMVFDVLALDGRDLRAQPLSQRRTALERLLRTAPAPLHRVSAIEGDGEAVAAAACAQGLEGIVSKRLDAPYTAGRNTHWLKTKCVASDEYVVVGYTAGKGARERLGALLLAEPAARGKPWRYRGRVGSGLDEALIARLLRQFIGTAPPALQPQPARAQLRGAVPHWVRPECVVEVEYRGFTDDGLLRQPSLKGLREDRSADSLRPGTRDRHHAHTPLGNGRSEQTSMNMPHLTHPDRVLFADPPITKRELAAFYTDIAAWILPGLRDRPVSLVRCPEGAEGECFFQKHRSPGFPDAVRDFADPHDAQHWLYIEDLDGLLGLVQMNALEYHVWGSTVRDIEHADRLVIDLDPAPDVPWKAVRAAALDVRERLEALDLASYLRTSGGKGLHVVVPLSPGARWDEARNFTHALAETMAREQPDRYVAVASKAQREGRVFIDYLRNGRGATAVCSYSLRNRPHAPIATPLRWDELGRLRSADQFRYANIRKRLASLAEDPWAGIDTLRQSLPRPG